MSNPESAAAIADELRMHGVDAMAVHADVANEADVEAMFAAVLDAWCAWAEVVLGEASFARPIMAHASR